MSGSTMGQGTYSEYSEVHVGEDFFFGGKVFADTPPPRARRLGCGAKKGVVIYLLYPARARKKTGVWKRGYH